MNEARDLGDTDRFAFYDHTKTLCASPPDVLRVNEKGLRQYYVFNCCGVITTTNYKIDGLFLPADDRRHFVAWSERKAKDTTKTYWDYIWRWYERGGRRHVASYLMALKVSKSHPNDVSPFDPKAPPPKTAAFWAIVDANRSPEEGEMDNVLETLKHPDAVTMSWIKSKASNDMALKIG